MQKSNLSLTKAVAGYITRNTKSNALSFFGILLFVGFIPLLRIELGRYFFSKLFYTHDVFFKKSSRNFTLGDQKLKCQFSFLVDIESFEFTVSLRPQKIRRDLLQTLPWIVHGHFKPTHGYLGAHFIWKYWRQLVHELFD